MNEKADARWTEWAIYAALAITMFAAVASFPKWTADDAYIAFRYATNLLEHGELTFNISEDPVEGYTGILLSLGIAAGMVLGLGAETAAHVIGVVSMLAIFAAFERMLSRLSVGTWLRVGALALLVSAAFMYTHVFSGMETLLFAALLLSSALQMHRVIERRSTNFGPHALLALLLLALALCRPEGAVFAILAVAIVTVYFTLRMNAYRPLAALIVVLAAPAIAYFVWRWQYYGYLLPNTFYVKTSDGFSMKTFDSLVVFAKQYLLIPTGIAIAAYVATLDETLDLIRGGLNAHLSKANVLTLGALAGFTAIVLAQYLRSTLAMNFSYRFFAPLYPVLLLMLAWLLTPSVLALRSRLVNRPWTRRLVPIGLTALLVLQVGLQVRWYLLAERPYASNYQELISNAHRPAGAFLHQRVPSDEWLVVHYDAGAIPYFSELRTVDFGALNDEFLAHNPDLSTSERLNYLFAHEPGAVVFTSYDWDYVSHGEEARAIVNDPRFDDYALIRRFGDPTERSYYQFVFLRRDLVRPGEEIQAFDRSGQNGTMSS